MASSYPGALDSLTNPSPGDSQALVSHAGQHADANDAIEAIQATLGVNPQGSSATVVARLNASDAALPGLVSSASGSASAAASSASASATSATNSANSASEAATSASQAASSASSASSSASTASTQAAAAAASKTASDANVGALRVFLNSLYV